MFINSEPDLEGAIYKSVFFEGLEDVYENYFQRKFKEEKGEIPFKFRLFTKNEIRKVLNQNGLEVIDRYGLSLLPSIVRIMMLRGAIDKNELGNTEEKMRRVMDYLNGDGKLNKHIIWKSVKHT